jgi:nucleotide-binding universal stress UspA family protein
MAHQPSYLVPVTDSPASLEAVEVACGLAKQRKARIYTVHVIEVLRSLPLNAGMETEARRGEQILRKAGELAAHGGCHAEASLLQARDAGQAIVDEARDRGVDAVILGVGYKRIIGSFQIGRTTDYVLKNASCQVWVVRQRVDGASGRPRE